MHKSEADKAVPQKLLDACAFIDDLFSETSWKSKLTKNKKLLDEVFSKKSVVAEIEPLEDRQCVI